MWGNKSKLVRQEQTLGYMKNKKKASGLGVNKGKSDITWGQSRPENEGQ